MAGAVFGTVQLPLFVTGAKFDEVAFKFHIQFSWQVQYLVQFSRHFSQQAKYLVKFGMIAGVQNNMAFFNTKGAWRVRKVTSVARRVAD